MSDLPNWALPDTGAHGITRQRIALQLEQLGDDETHEQTDTQPEVDADQG